jgi:septal ring factor EnvC (AmiA/AmiB activator)
MNVAIPMPPWLRTVLIGAGLFMLGGVLSFGYSYRPLHGALTWKVDELEERIDARNLENMKLEAEVTKLRSQEKIRVDPDSFKQIERELDKAGTALAQAEKDLKRAERKRKDANASASTWRKRYESLRDQTAAAAAKPAAQPVASPSNSEAPIKADAPAALLNSSPAPSEASSRSPAGEEQGILSAAPAADTSDAQP